MKRAAVLPFLLLAAVVGCGKKPGGPISNALSVSCGRAHACALLEGGKVACWGANERGQLGAGLGPLGGDASGRAVLVEGLPPVVRVSAGENHTCAIDREGAAWCWGSNNFGEIGRPDLSYTATHSAPNRVPGTGRGGLVLRDILAGSDGTCAIAEGRKLACWGSFNEIGGAAFVALAGDRGPGMAPDPQILAVNGVTNVARSRSHTCVTTSHNLTSTLACWGVVRDGQLGRPVPESCPQGSCKKPEPVTLPEAAPGDVEELAASGWYTCARSRSRDLYCWEHGATAAPETGGPKLTAPAVPPGVPRKEIAAVAAGHMTVCYLDTNGRAACFGREPWTARADGGAGPAPVEGLEGASRIAVGAGFACALVSGKVECWGAGARGQLGGGALVPSSGGAGSMRASAVLAP